MKILLGGALGRMGREVTAAAAEAQVEIVCGVDVAYTGQPSDYPIVTAFDQATQKADVLIDFSRPSALPELLQLARKEKMPTVLCATGYNEAELQMIEEASREIPVFRSANMSLGVNVLRHLVQEAARALFGAGSASANMPSTTVGEDIFAQDAVSVIDLLVLTKLAPSRGEARRLIEQGGIAVDDVKVTSLTESVKKAAFDKGYVVLKKGKKAFHKVILG